MTQQTGASKAQSTAIATAMASICNAAGARLLSHPKGRGVLQAAGRRCTLVVCHGTRPRVRLALRPATPRRVPSHSVNRP